MQERRASSRVRIKDVATLAGASVSTVSNLLNDRPHRMRPETVQRIQRAMLQLGYRPSWAARQLKTGFIPMVGLLVPSVANPFHGALARCVEEAALERGFQVVFGNSLRDPERERLYAENFWDFGIRGLIVASSPVSLQHFASLVQRGLHIVALDRSVGKDDAVAIENISMDNRLASYIATRHLLALGHRRIGYISGEITTVSRKERLQGYREALSEAGVALDSALVATGSASARDDDTHGSEHGRTDALALLAIMPPPTAFVALNDMHALGACAAIRERGLAVGRDISLVSIDDTELARLVDPQLTAVRQPVEALATASVERLTGRLRRGLIGPPQHTVIPPELVVRSSTGPPRAMMQGK